MTEWKTVKLDSLCKEITVGYVDLVSAKMLKPLIRETVLQEAIDVS